jgi:hypothetical protein
MVNWREELEKVMSSYHTNGGGVTNLHQNMYFSPSPNRMQFRNREFAQTVEMAQAAAKEAAVSLERTGRRGVYQ